MKGQVLCTDASPPHLRKPFECTTICATIREALLGTDVPDFYVACAGTGLQIVDVSDPAAPAVAVAGRYAYLTAGEGGLRIVDVADPTHPREVGFYQVTPGFATGLAAAGDYVYVADMRNGLLILRFRPPGP